MSPPGSDMPRPCYPCFTVHPGPLMPTEQRTRGAPSNLYLPDSSIPSILLLFQPHTSPAGLSLGLYLGHGSTLPSLAILHSRLPAPPPPGSPPLLCIATSLSPLALLTSTS